MKQELQAIATKIGELEAEKDEHQLVIDTISPLNPDRTCFRLVGGVLVKKTVKETLPLVDQNKQGVSLSDVKWLVKTFLDLGSDAAIGNHL